MRPTCSRLPQPEPFNVCLPARVRHSFTGGEGEIRTPEPLAGLPVFKTGAFNRSATSPYLWNQCVTAILSGRSARFWRRCFHFVSIAHQFRKRIACPVPFLWDRVGVGGERDVHIGVAECLRDRHDVDARGEQVRRERMPQVVEPHLAQARPTQRWQET